MIVPIISVVAQCHYVGMTSLQADALSCFHEMIHPSQGRFEEYVGSSDSSVDSLDSDSEEEKEAVNLRDSQPSETVDEGQPRALTETSLLQPTQEGISNLTTDQDEASNSSLQTAVIVPEESLWDLIMLLGKIYTLISVLVTDFCLNFG